MNSSLLQREVLSIHRGQFSTAPPKRSIKSISTACYSARPSWAKSSRKRGGFAAGRTYEKKVGEQLEALLGLDGSLLAGPWFYYKDENHSGYCQPDFLYFPNKTKTIVIVEAKLTWTPVVENELRELYSPVLEFVYPEYNQLLLAVCRNAAPGCPVPDTINNIEDFHLQIKSISAVKYLMTQWRL